MQFLEIDMKGEMPTTWTIDNYDGAETWDQSGEQPKVEFSADREANTSQYHKLMHTLYQWESKTDDLVEK